MAEQQKDKKPWLTCLWCDCHGQSVGETGKSSAVNVDLPQDYEMDEHEAPHMPAIPEKLEATRLQAYEERATVPEADKGTVTDVDYATLKAEIDARIAEHRENLAAQAARFRMEVHEKWKHPPVATDEEETHEAKVSKEGLVQATLEVYDFKESLWDALVFLGHIEDSFAAVDMIVLAILNLGMQAFFCILLYTLDMAETSENVFKEQLFDFVQWRVGVAHQAAHYDAVTNTSLAQRVCLEYGGTIESRRHESDFEEAKNYIEFGDSSRHSEVQGPGLLMLSLALWLILILKEVMNIIAFARMLVALTVTGDGTTKLHRDPDEGIIAASLSPRRSIAMFVCVVAPRMGIAAVLGFVGIFYLRRTFSVEEIILNAMALGFVLEIDELLFNFLPAVARSLVARCNPVGLALVRKDEDDIRRRASTKFTYARQLLSGLFEWTHVLFFITLVVVIVIRLTLIQAIQDSLEMSQLLMCEGNTAFIFKQHPTTNVIVVARTDEGGGDEGLELAYETIPTVLDAVLQASDLCSTLARRAARDIADRLELCDEGMWCEPCRRLRSRDPAARLYHEESLEQVRVLSIATDSEAFEQLSCEDIYTQASQTQMLPPLTRLLEGLETNVTPGVCSEMAMHCLHADLATRGVVRMYCPVECGCDHGDPDNVRTWYFNRAGCIPRCSLRLLQELTEIESQLVLGELPCKDRDLDLPSESAWRPYVEDVQEYLVGLGHLVKREGQYFASPATQAAFYSVTKSDFYYFSSTILHSTNRPQMTIGGCELQKDVPIDLVKWVRIAGSLCRWLRIVRYVFGLNLCDYNLVNEDHNPLIGLCPLTCALGPCSARAPNEEFDSKRTAWYNIMPWAKDALLNITCDRAALLCLRVELFGRSDWPIDWELFIAQDDVSQKLYERRLIAFWDPIQGMVYHASDLMCIRITNDTQRFTIESTDKATSLHPLHRGRMRWRLTELATNQILAVSGHSTSFRVRGKDWLAQWGVSCNHGSGVAVMTPWNRMQHDFQIIETKNPKAELPSSPMLYRLKGTKPGMFAWRKGLIEGGFDGQDVYVGCKAPPEPLDIMIREQDPIVCPNTSAATSCTNLTGRAICSSPSSIVGSRLAAQGCTFPPPGLSSDVPVQDLCPVSCRAQGECEVRFNAPYHYYHFYYTFNPPACLVTHCRCMAPLKAMQACWKEFGLTAKPDDFQQLSIQDRSIVLQVLQRATVCQPEERVPPTGGGGQSVDQWCYVDPQCTGSIYVETEEVQNYCAWRPATRSECSKEPPKLTL